jgi:hypothetical protein
MGISIDSRVVARDMRTKLLATPSAGTSTDVQTRAEQLSCHSDSGYKDVQPHKQPLPLSPDSEVDKCAAHCRLRGTDFDEGSGKGVQPHKQPLPLPPPLQTRQ